MPLSEDEQRRLNEIERALHGRTRSSPVIPSSGPGDGPASEPAGRSCDDPPAYRATEVVASIVAATPRRGLMGNFQYRITTPDGPGARVEDVLAEAPPVRREPAARERIRALNVAAGRRIAVLDDDPTGSQTVHDVSVVTVFEASEYAAGLAEVGGTCFIRTNTPQPAGGGGSRAHHGRRQ